MSLAALGVTERATYLLLEHLPRGEVTAVVVVVAQIHWSRNWARLPAISPVYFSALCGSAWGWLMN